MSEQITTVQQYFDRLARAFAGGDPAVAQDATYDAQEFLLGEREAVSAAGGDPGNEGELVRRLLSGFGDPEEVVESYRATEAQVAAALAPPQRRPAKSIGESVFGVFAEAHSYGALIFMVLSLPLGILYFTWAMVGVSLSAGFSILIFGFLFFLLFMSTVRAVALMECRIVETLLGERMPRRPAFVAPEGSWWERVKSWITDSRTWLTILYMILRLPLGVIYFTVAAILLSLAFGLLVGPFVQIFLPYPILHFFGTNYYLPLWAFPFFWLAGAFDLLLLIHLSRAIGRWHARFAKAMLVRPGA